MQFHLPKLPTSVISEDWPHTRVKRAFLVLPKSIGGDVRWLEWATWTDKLGTGGLSEPPFWYAHKWGGHK